MEVIMNWTATAINELKRYEFNKIKIKLWLNRLAIAESCMTSPRVASCSAAPVHGGGNRYEDKLLDYIVDCDDIRKKIAREKARIAIVDAALEALSREERMVLDRFYIHKTADTIGELCVELNYERTKIYEIRKEALRKFVAIVYGVDT